MIVERASGNTYLDTVVAPLRHQTELVFTMLTDTRGLLSWDEHQAIHDALQSGDADKARDGDRSAHGQRDHRHGAADATRCIPRPV